MKMASMSKALATFALAAMIACMGASTALAAPAEHATLLAAGTPDQASALTTQAVATYTGKYYTPYALVKNDGFIYRANASGTSIGSIWGDTNVDASATLDKVETLYIDANVTSLSSIRQKFYVGSQIFDRSIKLSAVAGQTNLDGLQKIVFKLDSSGKNACRTLPNDVFRDHALLDEVRNFDKTQVVEIPHYAFYRCSTLPSIALPATVRSVGDRAFQDCQKLGRITFGNNVATIGTYAFANCYLLGVENWTLSLPASLTSIGSNAFYKCQELKTLVLGNIDTTVSAGSTIFNGAGIERIYVYNKYLGNYLNNDSTKAWSAYRSKIHGFLEVANIDAQTWTGKAITPSVTATWLGSPIPAGNYSVAYANNINPGTAKVTVTGLGKYASAHNGYSCTVEKIFEIRKSNIGRINAITTDMKAKTTTKTSAGKTSQHLTANAKTAKVRKASLKKHAIRMKLISVSGAVGKVSYKKISGASKLSIDQATGTVRVKRGAKAKRYTMKVAVTAQGNATYASITKTITVKVTVK